ncbi:MAG: hypothetical protein OSA92_04110, partial [Pirellulaceae bacterium]|nr:hypothetical protein [Pirellulaceae bacterium]
MTATKTNSTSRRSSWTVVWAISWKTLRCGIIAYVVVLILLLLFENRLVYPLEPWDPQVRFGDESSLQEVYFSAADGVKLHALYHSRNRPRV